MPPTTAADIAKIVGDDEKTDLSKPQAPQATEKAEEDDPMGDIKI